MNFFVKKLAVAMTLAAVSSLSAGLMAIAQDDDAIDDGLATEGVDTEVVDLTALTCRDLLMMNHEDEDSVIVFYQGYLSGKSGDAEIGVDELRAASDRSIEQCIDEPDSTLMSVFEQNR